MIKKIDIWCRNLWIYFICIIGILTAIYLLMNWNDLSAAVKGCAFCAIIMPLHVIEEWKLPGGLHYIYNVFVFGPSAHDTNSLDRFPMSRLTDMFTNVGLTVVPLLYAWLSVIYPEISAALILCMIVFGLGELLVHTVVGIGCLLRYRKAGKRTIYDPGLGTSVMFFLPASIYLAANLPEVGGNDWLGCLLLFMGMVILCIAFAEFPFRKWVRSLNSTYFAFEDPKYFSKFVDCSAYPDKEIIIDRAKEETKR